MAVYWPNQPPKGNEPDDFESLIGDAFYIATGKKPGPFRRWIARRVAKKMRRMEDRLNSLF